MALGYAVGLERHYSKRDILEAYFNLAPYGGNIEGAGAAAEMYLGKSAESLTWPEAVALIPPSKKKKKNKNKLLAYINSVSLKKR